MENILRLNSFLQSIMATLDSFAIKVKDLQSCFAMDSSYDMGSLALLERFSEESQISRIYSSVRTIVTKYHNLGGISNRNLFSHGCGGWKKSKSKVLAGLFLWGLWGKNLFQAFLLGL